MSEYSFECWNSSCGDEVDRDWDEVEEDISGRMAYCSEDCFLEDCKREGDSFTQNRSFSPPYIVGDAASETRLLKMLKQRNQYIAHSIEEEEADSFAGNWHYVWVPDLEDLKILSEEIDESMEDIDYSDWEEFMIFTHPVKGIALIRAWDSLSSLSISVYISKGKIEMDSSPSEANFQKD